ncbi:MAG TPA: xanthine dehydrogenase family protein subunit M [Firmicutes bacterium]|nr:xanthine dehydrogenase family protein subunit M [Bacillota bacterium]
MYLPDFDYIAAATVVKASRLLGSLGPEAKLIAGGTDVLPMLKQGTLATKTLISINRLSELKNISFEKGKGHIIGALATHNEVMKSPVLQEKYMSVCETAHRMANNQIRNIGTIGGNISNAVPSADFPPILIALGATVTLQNSSGSRTLPLEGFFMGPRQSVIAQDEILTEIVIPENGFSGSTYHKFGLRRSGALAVVGVAVAVAMEGNICKDACIVLGAVAPTPMRAKEAEALLRGKEVSDALLEKAGKLAAAASNPITDIRGSEEYRRDMVRVFTRRCLRKAMDNGHV